METQAGFWFWAALLLTVLNSASAQHSPCYFAVGGNLTLELKPPASERISSILWKYNEDLVAEWISGFVNLTYYGSYTGRTTLDMTTGRLNIKDMTETDIGIYSVEINSKIQKERYDATAIEKVSHPHIWVQPVACGPAMDKCSLSCDGNTTEAGPVTYSWKKGNGEWEQSEKDMKITKIETGDVETFTCRMTNPVSQKESIPIRNPLFQQIVPHIPVWVVLSIFFGLAILVAVVGVIKRDFIREKICQLPCFNAVSRSENRLPAPTGNATEITSLNPPNEVAPRGEADDRVPA